MDMEHEDVNYEDTPRTVVFQKTSAEFKSGFSFAIMCIIDMVSNKPDTYTHSELVTFLRNFLLLNRSVANNEDKK